MENFYTLALNFNIDTWLDQAGVRGSAEDDHSPDWSVNYSREFMEFIDMFRDEVVADKHRDESWEAP